MENGFSSLIDGNMALGLAIPLVAALVFFTHEFGHYFTARLCRVHVESVAIGIGREIWARKDGRGTLWSIRIFPVCGFVHVEQRTQDGDGKVAYHYQSLWRRFLIVAAGPLSNVLLAWLMFLFFYTAAGQPSVPPYITGVEIGSPAEEAGFSIGDKIAAVNGKPARRFDELYEATQPVTGRPVPVTVDRGGQTIETDVTAMAVAYTDPLGFERAHGRIGLMALHQPLLFDAIVSVNGLDTRGNPDRVRELLLERMDRDIVIGTKAVDGKAHDYTVNISAAMNAGMLDPGSEDYNRVYLGRSPHNFYMRLDPLESMGEAFEDTARLVSGVIGVAGRIGRMDRSLIQPEVRVAREVSVWKYNMFTAIYIGICLSISIAVMNTLPIPGFDGSMLLRYAVEAAVGPERMEKIIPYISRAAFLFLIGVLMLINREVLALFMR